MRVAVEFVAVTNQQKFLEWLTAALNRPDIAVESISWPDMDELSNVGAIAQGLVDE